MGRSCQNDEHIGIYIERYRKAMALISNANEARSLFWVVMENTVLPNYDPWLYAELESYFAMSGMDYVSVSSFTARLLKLKYHFPSTDVEHVDLQRDLEEGIASDSLFLTMLEKTVNTDADLEQLSTKLRRSLLLKFYREKHLSPVEVRMASALAYQGINNEYAFEVTAEEDRLTSELRQIIEQTSPSVHRADGDLEIKLLVFGYIFIPPPLVPSSPS